MTQEQKDLLIKDLCARLPYGVKVQTTYINPQTKERKDIGTDVLSTVEISMLIDGYEEHKPYLFPLSSMTEEQKSDCPFNETTLNIINSNIGCYGIIEIPWRLSFLFIDWCNKNHFDYRGLIPMDLANDATGLNIY